MATGVVWALRSTANSTEYELVSFDFLGTELDTIALTIDDSSVIDSSNTSILARDDVITVFCNGRIHTVADGSVSEYTWGNYNSVYGRGGSYAKDKFIAFMYTAYGTDIGLQHSIDGISWTDTVPPYNRGFPQVFWDNAHSFYYHVSVDGSETNSGYLYTTTDFSSYTEIPNTGLSGEFGTHGLMYEDVLYCAIIDSSSRVIAFASVDNSVATEIPLSPAFSEFAGNYLSLQELYVNETGAICADIYESYWPADDYIAQYKLNESGTAFERQAPYTIYDTGMLSYHGADNAVAHVTTGGYVYIGFAEIDNGFNIVTPTATTHIPDDPDYPWISASIIDGDYSAFNEFWTEEDTCIEYEYEY